MALSRPFYTIFLLLGGGSKLLLIPASLIELILAMIGAGFFFSLCNIPTIPTLIKILKAKYPAVD